MFRDETGARWARQARREKKDQKVLRLPSLTPKDLAVVSLMESPPKTPANVDPILKFLQFQDLSIFLGPSPEEQATCFFFQNYVLDCNGLAKGSFQYLSDIYSSEEIGPALADGVNSLGLVGLAHFWGGVSSSDLSRLSNIKYNSAMKCISKKLRNIDEAKSDQTMVAIMLLSLYETNTCNSRQSMDSWTQHIKGATSLLQFRGFDKLKTTIGYNLFLQLRTQAVINCIQRHVPVPSIFSTWSQQMDFETVEQAAATQLSLLAIEYCNLRASMSRFEDYSNPERIITAACALDAKYAHWARNCPMQYIYQTIPLEERNDEVFSDHYHVYNTIFYATSWNHYRSNRILVNELIIDQLNWLYTNNPSSSLLQVDSRYFENQIMESNKTLLQLSHDICSSVPYFLGFDPLLKNASERQIPRGINGNLLLWPLYTAGVTGMVSEMMRKWVAKRLQWISEVMGIRQAAPLAFMMMKRKELTTWKEGHEIEEVETAPLQLNLPRFEDVLNSIDPSLLASLPSFPRRIETINCQT